MKKKLYLLPLALFSAFFVFSLHSGPVFADTEQPVLQFPVISDIHICGPVQTIGNMTICKDDTWHRNNDARFKKALDDLNTIAPNYQAIAVVGDITDHGLESQYDEFMQIFNSGVNPSAEKIITMGNHEFFEKHYWKPELTDASLVNRFVQKTGMPGLYYDKWVEGYHFITLGGETTKPNDFDSAYISDAQYNWLEKTIQINADSKKPIFVFLHQPIKDTVYGSEKYYGISDDRLKNILKKYPQAILFTGHSHYQLNNPRSVYQEGFTMVNTSSVNYDFADTGVNWNTSQGFLVNVYKDHVDLKAREFSNHTWINTFTVKLPYQETLNDHENPSFASTSKATVNNVTDSSVSLSWNSATDNKWVDKYDLKVNGKIVKEYYPNYLDPSYKPGQETDTISNLIPGTTYNIEIVAVDSWGNQSTNSLKVSTNTTSHYKGWKQINGYWYYFDPQTGLKKIGWLMNRNNWYYLSSDGTMLTGWQLIYGKWYYFNASGMMQTGWLKSEQDWYYLAQNGVMSVGWVLIGNTWYYFLKDGRMATGWITDKGM